MILAKIYDDQFENLLTTRYIQSSTLEKNSYASVTIERLCHSTPLQHQHNFAPGGTPNVSSNEAFEKKKSCLPVPPIVNDMTPQNYAIEGGTLIMLGHTHVFPYRPWS